MLPAARPIPITTTTASKQVATGLWVIVGWSFEETTNVAGASFALYDGQDATGTLVAPITLLTNESVRDLVGAEGLACSRGIYLSMVSGSIQGSVWAVPGELQEGLMFARGIKPVWFDSDSV